ncbi:hypothetical protein [Nonomuraea dietziae]|uniref:hypothetical protein n=1 Tax=Nonomuraea dietziae TaxID=65515 RepID=UPI0031DE2512
MSYEQPRLARVRPERALKGDTWSSCCRTEDKQVAGGLADAADSRQRSNSWSVTGKVPGGARLHGAQGAAGAWTRRAISRAGRHPTGAGFSIRANA